MAEPARDDAPAPAPGPGTRQPVRKPGPDAPRWAPVRNLLGNAAEAARLAAADLAAAPDCPTALRRVQMICDALVNLTAITCDLAEIDRGRVVDEAILEAERQRAYAQGVADCKAARCNLEVIRGG